HGSMLWELQFGEVPTVDALVNKLVSRPGDTQLLTVVGTSFRGRSCPLVIPTEFCHSCIATSLRNNAWTCPYCRAYLPSEGMPATDITNMMKNIYQNCTECETQVCLSEMRAHLRNCEQYIEKYGPLQEKNANRYACPLCQYELNENDLLDHFLTYHRSERRPVCCPICRLHPSGGPSYYSRNFIRHLQLRHTFYYEDYIYECISVIEEALFSTVLIRLSRDVLYIQSVFP
uniref:RING-type E3 ubiquitin transferase n=1 Tax=Anolis carolinensis TaxID=28377 RepID=A0A803TAQ5_ANOCA